MMVQFDCIYTLKHYYCRLILLSNARIARKTKLKRNDTQKHTHLLELKSDEKKKATVGYLGSPAAKRTTVPESGDENQSRREGLS